MKVPLICVVLAVRAFAFQEPPHDNAPFDMNQALSLLRENKTDDAINILKDALVKEPGASKPSALLAEILLFKERFDEADDVAFEEPSKIQVLQDALAKDPGGIEPTALLATAYLQDEQFDEADQLINAAVKAHPDSSRLHAVRGDIVFREGQPFEADAEYKAAVKLDPKNAAAYFGAARVFEMACMRAKAAAIYRTAHLLAPENSRYEGKVVDLEGNSPANIERWQKLLAEPGTSERVAMTLTRRIAEAKALKGRPEFDLASAYADYQMPLIPVMSYKTMRYFALTVSVGGAKAQLEVDTGAPGLLVSEKFAKRAGIERIADTEISGIGNQGPHKGWVGYADSIEIGGVVFHNCLVRVTDHMEFTDQDGLIGTNIFRRFFVTLNFYRRKLELSPLPGAPWDGSQPVDRQTLPDQKDFVQMLIFGHELLIPGKMSEKTAVDQTPGLFLIDTGSSRNLMSTKVGADVTRIRDNNSDRIRGVSGVVKKVYSADKVLLEFARFRQPNIDMLSVDLTGVSRRSGTEVAAILGFPLLSLFRSITLDYRDGLVKFDYKPL